MAWILLICAGVFEMLGITFLNAYVHSRKYKSLGLMLTFFAISFLALSIAMQQLPMSTAYAVWTGIGAVGTVLIGIFIFKEPVNFYRILFLITLIASIVGLKFVSH